MSLSHVSAHSIRVGSISSHQHFHGEGHARSRYRAEIEELLRRHDDGFVGRSRELARVVAFIGGRSPGYLLVEAAGGQGKSALMAQLLLRAERGEMPGGRPDVVAFFVRDPGGQRPDDFLSAVNGQLLSLLGRSGGTHYDVRALRNQFSELWDEARTRATAERPLLLLVDALDEQAGGELTIAGLLPESLADHVHVVVSSRPRPDAREQVGTAHPLRDAQILALGGLESLDVRALLRAGGLGSSLSDGDADRLAARVHALSRGEALLARHICEDVIARGESVLDHIERSPPGGIHDYFLRQVREIDEAADADATWDACTLLAVAVGPLSLDEIAEVLNVGRRQARRALEPVDRYLLGRERLQFFHRNLYTTILEEIGEKDAAQWRGRLADWCAGRANAPNQPVPRYVLEHCGEHLVADNRISELIALPRERWLREHRRELHALTAFARDVDLAYRACVPTPSAPAHPLDGLRMSVLLGSIGSTAQNVPPDAIWLLARCGRLDEAEGYVHLSTEPVARARALAQLARALAVGAGQARGREALDEALRLVLEGGRPASSAISEVVQAALVFDAQVWLDVLSRVMRLDPAFMSDVAEVATIGVHAHRAGDTETVSHVRRYLADQIAWFERELARYLATRAKLSGGATSPEAQPFEVDADSFEDIEGGFYGDLLSMAEATLSFEDSTGDAGLMNTVEALVTAIPGAFLASSIWARLAQAQAARGQTPHALELARRAAAPSDDDAANAVWPELYVLSRLAECVPVMTHGDLAGVRGEIVSDVARLCQSLPAGNWTGGYERLVEAWAAVGRADDLESLLARTAPAGGEYADYGLRGLHAAIARGLLTCGRLEAAAAAMELLPADVTRDTDRLNLIGRFLDAGRTDLAERMVSKLDYRPNRVAGLALMAAGVERHGHRDSALAWLERAIAAATVFGDETARVDLLAAGGRALAALGRRDDAARLAAQAAALNAPLPAGHKSAGSEVTLALLHIELGDSAGFLRAAPRRGDNWGMRYLSVYADALLARDGLDTLSTFFFETVAEEPHYLWPGDRVEHLAIRARVLRMLGYTTKASECIQAALAGLGGDGTPGTGPHGAGFVEVARFIREAGDAQRATEILERGVNEGLHTFPEASLARLARGFAVCGRQDRATAVATDALAAIDFTAVYTSTDGVYDALMAHAPADVPAVVDAFLARARKDGRTDYVRGVSATAVSALQDLRHDHAAITLLFETLPLFRGEARNSLLWALSQWAPLLSRIDPSGLLRLCEWTEEVTGWWERT